MCLESVNGMFSAAKGVDITTRSHYVQLSKKSLRYVFILIKGKILGLSDYVDNSSNNKKMILRA